MNEQIDRHFEWIAENPRYGYLIVGGILLLWLIGVICGWKWTYSLSTWGWNWVRETFGEKALRICVGALLVIGRRGVSLFCHDIGNEKTECLMRKQEYTEQERKRLLNLRW